MKTIRFDWSENPASALPDELVLCTNPLSEPPFVWFEDYFDYPGKFKEIYCATKEKSTNWTSAPEFQAIKVLGVPYLGAFEHHVHSIWMQVERDNLLVKNLLEKENPDTIIITGVRPNPEAIISCRFDPGLFELTLRKLAERRKIQVKVEGEKKIEDKVKVKKEKVEPGWFKKIVGAMSSQLQAFKYRQTIDNTKKMVLVSPQVFARIGSMLLAEAEKQKVTIVSTDTDFCKLAPSIYTLYGKQVSVLSRMKAYLKAEKAFGQIPKDTWTTAFAEDGIDYVDIAAQVLQIGLKKYLWLECYRLLLIQATIKNHCPVALLVLYDHGLFMACSVQLAKKRGVKTVTMQHGISNKDIPGYTPVTSDFFACWGDREKTTLIAQGVSSEKIIVTGYPAFDGLWKFVDKPKPDAVDAQKPIRVLIATQGVQASVEWRIALTPTSRIIHAIIALQLRLDKFIFTFRLHPNEELPPTQCILSEKKGIYITKGVPLNRQFAENDVIITQFSTIGFEALLADKALVSLNWVGQEELIPFAENGVAARSRTPEDLQAAIENSLMLKNKSPERRKWFLQQYLNGPHSAASLLQLVK